MTCVSSFDLEDHGFAVPDDRHAVVALLGQSPDQRAVLIGNIGDFERRPGKFQDAPLDDAERTPRKLNQFNHVKKWTALRTTAL